MRNVVVLACILALAVPPLAAQPRAGSETINVVLVEVPVTVLDREGNPVRGLTKANFELTDAGQKRDITSFEVLDFGKTPEPFEAISPAARRNFLVLFDLNHMTPGSLQRSREAVHSFVLEQMTPYDRVAVATTHIRNGFRMLTSFTTDRVLASLAIDTLGVMKEHHPKDPLLLTVSDFGAASSAARTAPGKFSNLVAEHLEALGVSTRKMANMNATEQITRHLDGVKELGRVLDRVGGRKQVILLSEGFDARMIHGREDLSSEEQKIEQRLIEAGRAHEVDTDNRYGNTHAAGTLKQMIDTLRRSDVVLHAIDVKGLRTDVDAAAGAQKSSNESLFLLTRDTGGTVFENANNLSGEFARMLKAQEVTYVLGFQTQTRAPGRFHELRVKLIDVPGARANYRVGYYEPSMATNALDRTLTAAEIVMNRLPVDDVKVKALVAPALRADGGAEVPVILEIDGKSLIEGVKEKEAAAEIFIYAFDSKESIADFVFQRVTLDLAKLRSKLTARGVKFYHTLRLPAGDYSVRALVRSSAGRHGFQDVTVHVPDAKERFVSTPLVFDSPGDWVMVKAPDRQGAAPYPFMAGEEMYVPAAGPVLAPGQSYNVALVTYNIPANLNVQAAIEGASGSVPTPVSLLGRTNPTAEGRVTTVLEMKPPKLARGPYSLVLLVKDQGSGAENRVSIPFEVQ